MRVLIFILPIGFFVGKTVLEYFSGNYINASIASIIGVFAARLFESIVVTIILFFMYKKFSKNKR